jgi:hypothetical protein
MAWLVRGTAAFILAAPLMLGGCQTLSGGSAPTSTSTSTSPSTSTSSPPAPRYNLAGYSAAFKAGYADACSNPRRRNAERFKSDNDYSMGWQDGSSACRGR